MKTLLLTGATGRFGRVLFDAYLAAGWEVLVITSSQAKLESLLATAENSERVDGVAADLLRPGAAVGAVLSLLDRGHRVNHLINAARSLSSLDQGPEGIPTRSNFVDEYILDVVTPYEISTALYSKQPDDLESIVNLGSQYGIVASNPNLYVGDETAPIQYACAKAAIVQLTKELAVRFAGQNVRVNCVAFGGVDGRVDDEFKSRYSALVPSGRMLTVEEIVGPIQFLTSGKSSSMTGHTIVADGGWSIW